MNGSEVVSIDIRVIKKNCIDKVFTATDRCMKTISIDDVVTVSDGPLEVACDVVGLFISLFILFLFLLFGLMTIHFKLLP